MACKKYAGWMSASAAGALRDVDEAELRAHVAGCLACRGEWEAIRALVAAVDRGIEAMVAGEPSPQFAARLRARIAREPEPTAWPLLTWPRFAVGALVAAAMLLAVWMVRAPERGHQPSPVAANAPAQVVTSPSKQQEAAQERAVASVAAAPQHRIAREQNNGKSLSMVALVPKGQLSAAFSLGEYVDVGMIDAEQFSQLTAQSAEPLEVKALVIAPLANPSPETARETRLPDGARD